MGLSHYSPLIRTVLVLQRLLADTKLSTVQTPDSTESCEKHIRHPEAPLVLREHFGAILPAAAVSIRVQSLQRHLACHRQGWKDKETQLEWQTEKTARQRSFLSTSQIKRLSQERFEQSKNHIIVIITFPFYNNHMAQCQLALGSHCCFSFLA